MKASLSLFALSLAVASLAPAATFYPISGISSSTGGNDLWPASNLIQGPGVGFDAAEPHTKTLTNDAGNWVTDAPGGFPSDYIALAGAPVLTLDLGSDVALSEISIWGYSATNSNGLAEFSLRFATDAEGAGGFGSSIAYNPTWGGAPGAGAIPNNDSDRMSFAFSEVVSARYVELTASDNWFVAPGDGSGGELAGGDRVGLGEIAFAIPEPSTTAFGLLAGLLFLRRRR